MLNFSIEKPLPISRNSQLLMELDVDDNWVSQLKIDEHRSFITLNNDTIEVVGWRGGSAVYKTKLKNDTGKKIVFDGGIIKTTIFKNKPMLYVFDVLLINGERTSKTYDERFDFVIKNSVPEFTVPELITDPIEAFDDIKNKKSKYVERLSISLKISLKEAYSIVEGLVLKNKKGVLRYPMNKCESPNQLKLRL